MSSESNRLGLIWFRIFLARDKVSEVEIDMEMKPKMIATGLNGYSGKAVQDIT